MDLASFRTYTAWHHEANSRRYDVPADPWELLPVSPETVTQFNNELRLNWGLGRVQGGDWDSEDCCHSLRETTIYRSLEQRFDGGADWEETPLYERAAAQLEEHDHFRGYESLEAFQAVRCEYIDELYRRIDQEGYRPNAKATHEKAAEDNPFEDAYANHLDPLVVIGRDGEIYWAEGFHRFTIASLLDIDEIPVLVLCRHENWQQVRERIHAADGALPAELDEYRDHPDVPDGLD